MALGGTSSTLPGPDGASFAYPAKLEDALTHRLPGVKVTVTAVTKPRQTAAQMAESIEQLLLDQKPSLVVWQTGTYDAVHGTDPEEFRAAVSEGVAKLKEGGADVVLVNMQYSPRTESIWRSATMPTGCAGFRVSRRCRFLIGLPSCVIGTTRGSSISTSRPRT